MILRNLLVALIVVMADVYAVACVSFFAIDTMTLIMVAIITMTLMMAMITHLIVMVFTLFTLMPLLLLLIGHFYSRLLSMNFLYTGVLRCKSWSRYRQTTVYSESKLESRWGRGRKSRRWWHACFSRVWSAAGYFSAHRIFRQGCTQVWAEKCQISFNMSSFNLIYRWVLWIAVHSFIQARKHVAAAPKRIVKKIQCYTYTFDYHIR